MCKRLSTYTGLEGQRLNWGSGIGERTTLNLARHGDCLLCQSRRLDYFSQGTCRCVELCVLVLT